MHAFYDFYRKIRQTTEQDEVPIRSTNRMNDLQKRVGGGELLRSPLIMEPLNFGPL